MLYNVESWVALFIILGVVFLAVVGAWNIASTVTNACAFGGV